MSLFPQNKVAPSCNRSKSTAFCVPFFAPSRHVAWTVSVQQTPTTDLLPFNCFGLQGKTLPLTSVRSRVSRVE